MDYLVYFLEPSVVRRFVRVIMYWTASALVFISIYHEVIAQESLEEATLAAATVTKDIAAEDAALGLFLLEVNLLISGHCRGRRGVKGTQGASEDQF